MEANCRGAEFDGLNGIFDLEETTFGAEGVDASIVFGTGEIHSIMSIIIWCCCGEWMKKLLGWAVDRARSERQVEAAGAAAGGNGNGFD